MVRKAPAKSGGYSFFLFFACPAIRNHALYKLLQGVMFGAYAPTRYARSLVPRVT